MIIGVDYHPSFQTIAFLMEETGECGELSNAAAACRLNSIRQYVHFSQCLELNCLGSNMAGFQLRIRLNFGILLAEHILPCHKELDTRSHPANRKLAVIGKT